MAALPALTFSQQNNNMLFVICEQLWCTSMRLNATEQHITARLQQVFESCQNPILLGDDASEEQKEQVKSKLCDALAEIIHLDAVEPTQGALTTVYDVANDIDAMLAKILAKRSVDASEAARVAEASFIAEGQKPL